MNSIIRNVNILKIPLYVSKVSTPSLCVIENLIRFPKISENSIKRVQSYPQFKSIKYIEPKSIFSAKCEKTSTSPILNENKPKLKLPLFTSKVTYNINFKLQREFSQKFAKNKKLKKSRQADRVSRKQRDETCNNDCININKEKRQKKKKKPFTKIARRQKKKYYGNDSLIPLSNTKSKTDRNIKFTLKLNEILEKQNKAKYLANQHGGNKIKNFFFKSNDCQFCGETSKKSINKIEKKSKFDQNKRTKCSYTIMKKIFPKCEPKKSKFKQKHFEEVDAQRHNKEIYSYYVDKIKEERLKQKEKNVANITCPNTEETKIKNLKPLYQVVKEHSKKRKTHKKYFRYDLDFSTNFFNAKLLQPAYKPQPNSVDNNKIRNINSEPEYIKQKKQLGKWEIKNLPVKYEKIYDKPLNIKTHESQSNVSKNNVPLELEKISNKKVASSLPSKKNIEIDEHSKEELANTIGTLLKPVIEQEYLKYNEVKIALERLETNLNQYFKQTKIFADAEKIEPRSALSYVTKQKNSLNIFDKNNFEIDDPASKSKINDPFTVNQEKEEPKKNFNIIVPSFKNEEFVEPCKYGTLIAKLYINNTITDPGEKMILNMVAKKDDSCKDASSINKKEDPCSKKDTCKQKDLKKNDPCKKQPVKKDEDSYKIDKKEDPCKKKDPCKQGDPKSNDPCKKAEKKDKDPCKKRDSCKIDKKDDPCRKKDPCKQDDPKNDDPCKKVAAKKDDDPCKKKDPCKIEKEEIPCKKKDPCKQDGPKKDDPCKKNAAKENDKPCKKKDPCEKEKKEDPCKKKDPCKQEDPKKNDPCNVAKKDDNPCKMKDSCEKEKSEYLCKQEDLKKENTCIKAAKKEDPCKNKNRREKEKENDPCEKKDPCKKKETEDPCKKKDPCKQEKPKKDICNTKPMIASEVICGKVESIKPRSCCEETPICRESKLQVIEPKCPENRLIKDPPQQVKGRGSEYCSQLPMPEDCPMTPIMKEQKPTGKPTCCLQRSCSEKTTKESEPPNCCQPKPQPKPACAAPKNEETDPKCSTKQKEISEQKWPPKKQVPCTVETKEQKCKEPESSPPSPPRPKEPPKRVCPPPLKTDMRYCTKVKKVEEIYVEKIAEKPKCARIVPRTVPSPPAPKQRPSQQSLKKCWTPVKIEKKKPVLKTHESKSEPCLSKSKPKPPRLDGTLPTRNEQKTGFIDGCKGFVSSICKIFCPGKGKKSGKKAAVIAVATTQSMPEFRRKSKNSTRCNLSAEGGGTKPKKKDGTKLLKIPKKYYCKEKKYENECKTKENSIPIKSTCKENNEDESKLQIYKNTSDEKLASLCKEEMGIKMDTEESDENKLKSEDRNASNEKVDRESQSECNLTTGKPKNISKKSLLIRDKYPWKKDTSKECFVSALTTKNKEEQTWEPQKGVNNNCDECFSTSMDSTDDKAYQNNTTEKKSQSYELKCCTSSEEQPKSPIGIPEEERESYLKHQKIQKQYSNENNTKYNAKLDKNEDVPRKISKICIEVNETTDLCQNDHQEANPDKYYKLPKPSENSNLLKTQNANKPDDSQSQENDQSIMKQCFQLTKDKSKPQEIELRRDDNEENEKCFAKNMLICKVKQIGNCEQLICTPMPRPKPLSELTDSDILKLDDDVKRILKCKVVLDECGKEILICKEIKIAKNDESRNKNKEKYGDDEMVAEFKKILKRKNHLEKQQAPKKKMIISKKLVCKDEFINKCNENEERQKEMVCNIAKVKEIKFEEETPKCYKPKPKKCSPYTYKDLLKKSEELRKSSEEKLSESRDGKRKSCGNSKNISNFGKQSKK